MQMLGKAGPAAARMHAVTDRARASIRVEGIVQGVGFRPFVHSLATRLRLAGFVGNDARGVVIEVEGRPADLDAFREALTGRVPPLAVVERVTTRPMAPDGRAGFTIAASRAGGQRQALISPDTATCRDCLAELFDPTNRRYRYPFVNCTNCGPRFTIITDVPYDRPNTTMAGFAMCVACAREYHDPAERRFHAQPTCCPDCGPRLRLVDGMGQAVDVDPIAGAAAALRAGQVVAIKGLGGYHLAADAASDAVAALRTRKHREDKPFAVMVADLDAARRLCALDEVAEQLMTSPRCPIVVLPRHVDAAIHAEVAPASPDLGLMLPYTPLHHLLARRLGRPLVLTSGNVSDEPIAYHDDEARQRLSGIAELFLLHDRPIHMRTDDSVVRVVDGAVLPIRRSRGYAPQPVLLPVAAPRPVLACGAELKSTFCLAKGNHAFVSHHIGDLENYETLRSFVTGIEHFRRLFDVSPQVVAHDLHPEYLSTKYARQLPGVRLVGVQHHHAHVASCLADNGESGPVIGVAFDGLGYGLDDTLWGGEVLVADLAGFRRAGHLEPVPLPGGAAAIRQPWRMALAYLDRLYGDDVPPLDITLRHAGQWAAVRSVARGATLTSSAGRLFDAVAAIVGVRDTINYEGQAAVELQHLADAAEPAGYPARIVPGAPFRLAGEDLVRDCVAELTAGVAPAAIAARFHNGLADLVVAACRRVRDDEGLSTVALSGGVFQNALLLRRCRTGLTAAGFRVLTHRQVPPNDGGISLGQAAIAAAS